MALLDPTKWVDRTANSAAAFQVDISGAAKPGMLWGGASSNIAIASLVGRMLFTDHKVTAKVETPGGDDVFWILLRSNNAHQVGLLAFQGGALCITTSAGTFATLGDNYTIQAQTPFAVTWADGDIFSIEARGNTYTVYRNGAYQLRWTDDTGIYSANAPDHKQVAMAYIWRSFTTGGFDSFAADDLFIWPSLNGSDGDGALSALVAAIENRSAALLGSGALTALTRVVHPPTYTQYLTNTTVPWPSWANNCDGISLGGGGGGGAGGFGTQGGGGGAGNFGQVTWTRAQWIAGGSGNITMSIGGGGNRGGSTGQAGTAGGTTSLTLAGVGTVSGTGGAAGGGGTNAPQGGGGGTLTYNGQGYTRAGPVGNNGTAGPAPGCGGNGGASLQAGGAGGAGGTWLYFYE
jgi:hypothetical protein